MNNDELYFKMTLLQAEVEMKSMVADNQMSETLGLPPMHTGPDFLKLIEKYSIHHNNFPFYKG